MALLLPTVADDCRDLRGRLRKRRFLLFFRGGRCSEISLGNRPPAEATNVVGDREEAVISGARPFHIATLLYGFVATVSTQAFAADPQTCRQYSNLAMKDFLYASKSHCPFEPSARWRPDADYHYNWCLTASDCDLQAESDARRTVLIGCGLINKETPRPQFCTQR
jgi:hypothetical protein